MKKPGPAPAPGKGEDSHAVRRSCEICNGKGTILAIVGHDFAGKPITGTKPCPKGCKPTR